MVGDFNINTMSTNSADYLDLIHQYNTQNIIDIISKYYRYPYSTSYSATCIDHILINFHHLHVNIVCCPVEKDIPDYQPIFACYNKSLMNESEKILKLSYKNFNPENLKDLLNWVDWGTLVYQIESVDLAYNNFRKTTKETFDQIVLIKKTTCRKPIRFKNFWMIKKHPLEIRTERNE